MKKYFATAFIAFVVVLAIACKADNSGNKNANKGISNTHAKKASARICSNFVIADDKLFYNDKELMFGTPAEKFGGVIGAGYRVSDADLDPIYTWDKLGVYILTRKNVVVDLSLSFIKKELDPYASLVKKMRMEVRRIFMVVFFLKIYFVGN